jgi:polysaccharide export outer membrane protein
MMTRLLASIATVCIVAVTSLAADVPPTASATGLLPGQLTPAFQIPDFNSAAAPAPGSELPAAMASLDNRQPLNPQDRITLRVIEDREDPKPLIVTDSGEIELPYGMGRVKVAGKTCLEVSKEIKVLVEKDYYHKATPLVQIELLNRARGRVYVHGEVRTPGHQEIPSDEVLTVSKAVLRAGGFAPFANKSKVIINRKSTSEGQPDQRIVIDVSDILERGRTKDDMILKAEDMIFVPSRVINF